MNTITTLARNSEKIIRAELEDKRIEYCMNAIKRAKADYCEIRHGDSVEYLMDALRDSRDEVNAWIIEQAPRCAQCEFSSEMRDARGTGDSPTEYECVLASCPWGKP
jgi:hypothetical protein